MPDHQIEWVGVQEAAKRLGVTHRAIQQRIERNTITHDLARGPDGRIIETPRTRIVAVPSSKIK